MTHPSLASVHLSAVDAGIQGETSNASFWSFLICGSKFGALQGWTPQVFAALEPLVLPVKIFALQNFN